MAGERRSLFWSIFWTWCVWICVATWEIHFEQIGHLHSDANKYPDEWSGVLESVVPKTENCTMDFIRSKKFAFQCARQLALSNLFLAQMLQKQHCSVVPLTFIDLQICGSAVVGGVCVSDVIFDTQAYSFFLFSLLFCLNLLGNPSWFSCTYMSVVIALQALPVSSHLICFCLWPKAWQLQPHVSCQLPVTMMVTVQWGRTPGDVD